MKKDTVVSIDEPTTTKDALTEMLREGAQKLLAEAVQAELEELLEEHEGQHDDQGRTAKTRGCLSRLTMLTMVFKLCRSAEKRWRRLQGYRRLGEVVDNVRFVDCVREDEVAA